MEEKIDVKITIPSHLYKYLDIISSKLDVNKASLLRFGIYNTISMFWYVLMEEVSDDEIAEVISLAEQMDRDFKKRSEAFAEKIILQEMNSSR